MQAVEVVIDSLQPYEVSRIIVIQWITDRQRKTNNLKSQWVPGILNPFRFYHLLVLWLSRSDLTPLGLSFLFCKMGNVMSNLHDSW